jgi:hypothetical protein
MDRRLGATACGALRCQERAEIRLSAVLLSRGPSPVVTVRPREREREIEREIRESDQREGEREIRERDHRDSETRREKER